MQQLHPLSLPSHSDRIGCLPTPSLVRQILQELSFRNVCQPLQCNRLMAAMHVCYVHTGALIRPEKPIKLECMYAYYPRVRVKRVVLATLEDTRLTRFDCMYQLHPLSLLPHSDPADALDGSQYSKAIEGPRNHLLGVRSSKVQAHTPTNW